MGNLVSWESPFVFGLLSPNKYRSIWVFCNGLTFCCNISYTDYDLWFNCPLTLISELYYFFNCLSCSFDIVFCLEKRSHILRLFYLCLLLFIICSNLATLSGLQFAIINPLCCSFTFLASGFSEPSMSMFFCWRTLYWWSCFEYRLYQYSAFPWLIKSCYCLLNVKFISYIGFFCSCSSSCPRFNEINLLSRTSLSSLIEDISFSSCLALKEDRMFLRLLFLYFIFNSFNYY